MKCQRPLATKPDFMTNSSSLPPFRLRLRYRWTAASLLEPHCCDEGAQFVSVGFGGGRCGGCRTAVVSGQWSVVSGQWSVVSGQWSVVSGQWSKTSAAVAGRALEGGVAGGVELQWLVVSGLGQWSVASGLWQGGVVELQWSVVSGQWPKTSAAVAGRALEGALRGVSNCTREGRRPHRPKATVED